MAIANWYYTEENYRYFLKKLDEYVSQYIDVYAYALLPNHFHCLAKIKQQAELNATLLPLQKGQKILLDYAAIASEAFRRFFLCYAKSIKVQQGRTGSLFEKTLNGKKYKARNTCSGSSTIFTVIRIHRNPETHGFTNGFRSYPHSSYETEAQESAGPVWRPGGVCPVSFHQPCFT